MKACLCGWHFGGRVHNPQCPPHNDPIDTQLAAIRAQLTQVKEKVMTAQDDINAASAALTAFLADLEQAVTNIQAELAAQAPQVDTSALNALVAQLPAVQASVDALESPPAAPEPVTPPAS